MDFQKLLQSLSQTEKEALYTRLKKELENSPTFEDVKAKLNQEQKIYCPHCESEDIVGHGSYNGRKRYKCKRCNKTFNDFTGTAISGLKKVEKFHEYLEICLRSLTIRRGAKMLGVSTKTIFEWRHKISSSLSSMNGQSFSGIVECDDKQMDINEKGNKNLKRKAYKRPSDRNKKRGVSNDKVSLMVATDRKGCPTMQVAKIGRIDSESLDKVMGGIISLENVLCSDSHPTIISWAKDLGLEHHTFIASKQHVKDKCYHVQHVNSLDNLFERWVSRFYGIATKYLPQYLNWFIFLEKMKKALNPLSEFAKILVTNTKAINNYRTIEEKYKILLNPQYSNT